MRADFRLEDWIIRPRRDCIERGDEIIHIMPKPMAVLECLAAAGGEVVTRDELFKAVWPGAIVTDDALTQCVVELRKAFGDSAHEAKIIRTIPKVGFCLVPPVMELPEPQTDSDEQPDPKKTIVRATLIIIVAIMLAAAMYWYLGPSRDTVVVVPSSIPSIAVLPFADLSEGRDQEYFADGLSEELLNVLARLEGLKVTGRTSSFHFRGRNEDLRVIAETLGVSYLLEGSVRKDEGRLRITAQLLDTSNGFQLWSESYDRELKNIFAVQEEISGAIVGALKEQLGLQVEMTPRVMVTTNTEAHDAYLRGRYLVVQKMQASVEGAAREFEKAIAFDPEYALAHAELAMTSLRLHQGNYGDLTYTEMMARAAPQAERAMVLDPALAEAHTATGYLLWFQDKPEEALAHFRQAIRINPNYSTAYNLMANLLRVRFGSYGESFAMHAKALSLDPLSISAIRFYVLGLIERNRLDEASRELEKLASISPADYARIRGILTSLGGKWANSALGHLDALRVDPGRVSIRSRLSRMLAILGLEKEALAFSASNLSPTVLRILGRPADAVTSAEARVAENPMILIRRHSLGLALASAGDYTRARPILEEMWQRSGGRVVRSGPLQTDSAAALIAIRRDAGAEAEVGELITAIRDHVRRCHEAGIIRHARRLRNIDFNIDFPAGLAAYLAGEHERGLALIAKAAEDGDFIPPNEAYLQTLYDDPGFAPILASQEARQARERNRFLAIVCTDNPYETVWQPAEGTCERFFVEAKN